MRNYGDRNKYIVRNSFELTIKRCYTKAFRILALVHGAIQLTEPVAEVDLASDHLPVICEIVGHAASFNTAIQIKDYKNANWLRFSTIIRHRITAATCSLSTKNEVDRSIGLLSQAILDAEQASCQDLLPVKSCCHLMCTI